MIQAHISTFEDQTRLFIASSIPYDVKHELIRLQNNLIESHVVVGTYPKQESMHLTLKFIGQVPADKVPDIQKRLQSITYKSMHAQLTLLMVFGNPQFPKVIYVDVDCSGLKEFVAILDENLKDFCKPEEREYKSHLTIVRIRQTLDSDGLLEWLDKTYVNTVPFPIDHFSLMQSALTGTGPVHTTIERYHLMP